MLDTCRRYKAVGLNLEDPSDERDGFDDTWQCGDAWS
jgi:hypothetical protein